MTSNRISVLAGILVVLLPLVAARAAEPDQTPTSAPDPVRLEALLDRAAQQRAAAALLDDLPPAARRQYDAAVEHEQRGEYDDAAVALDAALRETTVFPFELLELLARVKYEQQRPGEARVAAALASRMRPDDPSVQYLLGKLAVEQDRTDEAVACFLAATQALGRQKDDPHGVGAWYELGDALEQSNRPVAAGEAYERFDAAVWGGPPALRQSEVIRPILEEHPRGLLGHALDLFAQAGLPNECIRAARAALEVRPADAYVERLLVQSQIDAKRYEEAYATARAIVDRDLAKGETPALLSLTIEAADRTDRLAGWIAEIRADLTDDAKAAFAERFAQRLDRLNLTGQSPPIWEALLKRQPDQSRLAWGLATALKDAGDFDAAMDVLAQHYRQLGPRLASGETKLDLPVGRLARWLRSQKATRAMLEALNRQSERSDSDAATFTVFGLAAVSVEEFALAERLFDTALAQDATSVLARLGRAHLNIRRGQWDNAKTDANAAIEQAPGLALARWTLATACAGLDENDAAEKAYRKAVELDPKNVDYLLAAARHLRRTGNLLGAQRFLQDASSADPARGDVLEELVSAYLEGGKTDLARDAIGDAESADVGADALRRARTLLRFAPDLASDEYVDELRRQHRQHPDDTDTALNLATVLLVTDHYHEAGELLQQIDAADDDARERLLYLRARAHLRNLEPDRAAEVLATLAQRYPNRRPTLAALAGAYAADFDLPKAREIYARIAKLPLDAPQREQLRAQWLGTYVDFMQYDDALAVLDQWRDNDPNDASLDRLRIRVLRTAGRFDDALAGLRTAIEPAQQQFYELVDRFRGAAGGRAGSAPPAAELSDLEKQAREASEALYALRGEFVETALDGKRYSEAETAIRAWLEREPTQPQLREWLVDALLDAKKPDDALAALRDYTPANALDLARAVAWRARALAGLKRTDDGVRELQNLLKEQPIRSNPPLRDDVRRVIIGLLATDQDFQRAVRLTEEWMLEADNDQARFDVLTMQRAIYLAAERQEDHLRVAEALLKLQPRDPGLCNDLGYSLADHGEQIERAAELVRRAVAAEPLNAAYQDSLGWVYYKQADFAAAHRYLARATQLRQGQDSVVFDHLGDAACRLGDRDAARRAWSKSLELIDQKPEEDRKPPDTELLAAVRKKLAALDADGRPPLAPTAAETQGDRKSGDAQ